MATIFAKQSRIFCYLAAAITIVILFITPAFLASLFDKAWDRKIPERKFKSEYLLKLNDEVDISGACAVPKIKMLPTKAQGRHILLVGQNCPNS